MLHAVKSRGLFRKSQSELRGQIDKLADGEFVVFL